MVDSSTSHHLIRSNGTLQTEEIHLLCLKDPPATPWAAIWGSGSRLDITSDIHLIWCEHTYLDIGRVCHRCRHDQVPLLRVEPNHRAGAGPRLRTMTIARSCSRCSPRGRSAPRSSAVCSEIILVKKCPNKSDKRFLYDLIAHSAVYFPIRPSIARLLTQIDLTLNTSKWFEL